MLRIKAPVLCLLLLLLGACAGPGPQQHLPAAWSTHSAQLQALQHWQATGKLALRSSRSSESGNLTWQQREAHSHVQLSGPLGVAATVIDSDGQQMTIRQGQESRTLDISTPESITYNTGWALPLHALPHWLKGLPAPGSDIQQLELIPDTGLLRTLRQDDWAVSFDDYRNFDALTLPTRVEIKGADSRATVLIRQWRTLAN